MNMWRRPEISFLSSLKGRLLLLAAIVLMAGLALFAVQLSALFRQHVERTAKAQLELYLEQLIVALQKQPDGSYRTNALLPDPRFMRPLSGLYWQVNDGHGHVLARSRSLWDGVLPAPSDSGGDVSVWFDADGPADEQLLILARKVQMPSAALPSPAEDMAKSGKDGDALLLFMVGRDKAELEAAAAAFRRELVISLAVLSGVLLLALTTQVWLGLRPLTALRRQIATVRGGRAREVRAPALAEIQALVDELNALLAEQRRHMERARARAGNLAHGLKTPLAALTALARDLLEAGHKDSARAILQQVLLLRRQVEHELSRARVRGGRHISGGVSLARTITRLLQTVQRLQNGNRLRWQTDIAPDLHVRMEEGDLLELAGNLLENAAKWARSEVRIGAAARNGHVALTIEDDGPGVPAKHRKRILERGVRLDEQMPGSGLGLAIVQEIVEAYEGRLELADGSLGGLSVRVHLPKAEAETT